MMPYVDDPLSQSEPLAVTSEFREQEKQTMYSLLM